MEFDKAADALAAFERRMPQTSLHVAAEEKISPFKRHPTRSSEAPYIQASNTDTASENSAVFCENATALGQLFGVAHHRRVLELVTAVWLKVCHLRIILTCCFVWILVWHWPTHSFCATCCLL